MQTRLCPQRVVQARGASRDHLDTGEFLPTRELARLFN